LYIARNIIASLQIEPIVCVVPIKYAKGIAYFKIDCLWRAYDHCGLQSQKWTLYWKKFHIQLSEVITKYREFLQEEKRRNEKNLFHRAENNKNQLKLLYKASNVSASLQIEPVVYIIMIKYARAISYLQFPSFNGGNKW